MKTLLSKGLSNNKVRRAFSNLVNAERGEEGKVKDLSVDLYLHVLLNCEEKCSNELLLTIYFHFIHCCIEKRSLFLYPRHCKIDWKSCSRNSDLVSSLKVLIAKLMLSKGAQNSPQFF